MAQWQGPALCCYNNSVFTPADFHHISRIGQDSKLDKPAATGLASRCYHRHAPLSFPLPHQKAMKEIVKPVCIAPCLCCMSFASLL